MNKFILLLSAAGLLTKSGITNTAPATPAKPIIAWMSESYDIQGDAAVFDLTWNMWWGVNGEHWKVLQNDQLIYVESIVASSSLSAQTATKTLTVNTAGTYEFSVQLCNGVGNDEICTNSDSKTVTIQHVTDPVAPNPPPPVDPTDPVAPSDPVVINISTLNAMEQALTDTQAMQQVKRSIRTLANAEVELIQPGRSANPINVKRIEAIINASDWDYLFPYRAAEYSYTNLLQAVGKFPAFCGGYDDGRDADLICRKSLATAFAHFTQETGGHTSHWEVPEWRQGLHWLREMGWTEQMRNGYNSECNPDTWQGQTWVCGTFPDGSYKSYFGRGAKQLSYNYNYGPFSDAMFGTTRTLLDHPELVADTWLNLASAIFFYIYPQPPKPSMIHVIDGTWQPNDHDIENGLEPGFGVTTQIINGGVECGGSVEVQQSLNRISYYQNFAPYLQVEIPANEVLGCKGMKQYDAQGSGALSIYWEQDWSWSSETPDGKSYACQLVIYQTPFSAFKEGDYAKCVEHFFDVIIDYEH